MAGFIADRVCETSTTTGTGTFTLSGAVAGFQTFNHAGAGSSPNFYYLIEAVDGNGNPTGDWEVGQGNLPTSTTLARTMIIASSNNGSAVSFASGPKRVHLSAPAQQIGFLGGQYGLTTNIANHDWTTAGAIGWDNRIFDNEPITGFHSTITNNSRITIPTGYQGSFVRLRAQVALNSLTANDWVSMQFRYNGGSGAFYGQMHHSTGQVNPVYQLQSALIQVSDADYFELFLQTATDTSVTMLSGSSWFEIEVLQ